MALPFSGATNAMGDEQRRAELYTRIYKYAAEDFISTRDFTIFEKQLYAWMISVEARLQKLFVILSNHTHPLIPHVHAHIPHVHISGAPGNSTSPEIIPLVTLPNTPYIIPKSIQSPVIKWIVGFIPRFINTTGTIPNLTGNNVVIGAKLGIAEGVAPHLRRGTIIPILAVPSVPEYVTGLAPL